MSNRNILGIKFGGHDTAASLLMNGKIVAACAQERFTHDKHSRLFPIDAIKKCLQIGKIKITDIDEIAFVNDIKLLLREIYFRPALQSDKRLDYVFSDLEKIKYAYNTENLIRNKLNYKGLIKFYRHHLCHVASAYYPSGFKNALCISVDGRGEYETGITVVGKSGKLKVLNNENIYPHSIGLLYSAITHYLGWRHHCDEGIIMGLAPYGNDLEKIPGSKNTYKKLFKKILTTNGKLGYKLNLELIDFYTERDKWVSEKFIKIFGKKRKYGEKITKHHKNIAAALQNRIEEIIIRQLKYLRKKTGLNKLCIAGGVGLNCSLNGKIVREKIFSEVFIQPASGDDGCSMGACLLANNANGKRKILPKKNHNSYLGPSFNNNEIVKSLKKSKLRYKKQKKIHHVIAKHIYENKIIAWFQGSSEFGPRALGNRSILCKPFPSSMKDHLNKNVKFREPFRPFAPAVLEEFQNNFFELKQNSPHMLIACKVRKDKKKLIPAVVHVDDTCRVQTVKKNLNKKFYDLIVEFKKISGIPVLLNTSFNVKGQPIVNTPEEAIKCFKNTKIDILAIGDYVVEKNGKKKN